MRAAFHTLGCKVNAYETEAMKQRLLSCGYTLCTFDEPADVYVINTCSVTNIADRKSRQMIHRAKKQNPAAVIVAAGCYVQAAGEKLKAEGIADIILGNEEKKEIGHILAEYFASPENGKKADAVPGPREAVFDVGNIGAVRQYDDLPAGTMEDYTRAFLKVEDGCNRFCSYCIIPYVRGRVRSRKCGDILMEAAHFAGKGYRELVLTGINLSSYGTDLPEEEPVRDLAALVRELDRTEGVDRIRLGSLDPQIVTKEFLQTLASLKTFCPHFHLSMQSGCDSTLRRMNRAYTTSEYREDVELIRDFFPDAAVTTDVIVGFPGETEEEFAKTQAFIRDIHFYETHIFPYSRREGTKAAEMTGQLTAAEKAARAEILSGINRENAKSFREKRIGRQEEVLTEEAFLFQGKRYLLGNTREYVKVAVPLSDEQRNKLVCGRISSFLMPDILLMDKIIGIS